jgi:hypothetical protein
VINFKVLPQQLNKQSEVFSQKLQIKRKESEKKFPSLEIKWEMILPIPVLNDEGTEWIME